MGAHPVVRMPDGYELRGWPVDQYKLATVPTSYVLLREENSGRPGETQHADLEAALKWLRDNNLNGRFEVLYVTKGDTYESKTEVTRI